MLVITPTRGLLRPEEPITVERLREFSQVDIETRDPRYQLREKFLWVLLPGVGLLLSAFLLRSTLFGEVPAA